VRPGSQADGAVRRQHFGQAHRQRLATYRAAGKMVNGFAIRVNAMPLSRLADMLSPRVERPVQDRTGLAGNFDLDLQWRPEPDKEEPLDASLPDSLPTSIFTALQEQLGLKLESTKGPVDALVIDHVEHPTEN
jgi:uncharacterized protein (TIGR03435 family)